MRQAKLSKGVHVLFMDPLNKSSGHAGRLVSWSRSVAVVKVQGHVKNRHIPVTHVEGWWPKHERVRNSTTIRTWPEA
jgi:hypothetical protein